MSEEQEQQICVSCGFCCDGTLFLHAVLTPGERGHLPEKIEQRSYSEGEGEYFRLPCLYFEGKCSIYDRDKAYVCSAYRCQLLRDFADGRVTLTEALKIVEQAREMRSLLMEQYHKTLTAGEAINFRELLLAIGKEQKSATEPLSIGFEMLVGGCNIFEALLIKHFRSASDFEKMRFVEGMYKKAISENPPLNPPRGTY